MSWKSVNAELIESITQQAAERGITDAAIVALIGAADSFTMSTNPASDPTSHHHELNETSGRTAGRTTSGRMMSRTRRSRPGTTRRPPGLIHLPAQPTWFTKGTVHVHQERGARPGRHADICH